MNVLITGAQFANRGAQSMLFTVVNEFRTRYADAEFYYVPLDYSRKDCFACCDNYKFHFVYDDLAMSDYPIKYGFIGKIKRCIDRAAVNMRIKEYDPLQLSNIWDNINVLVDVSGYSLTSKFGMGSINRMLRHINKAKSLNIPVILMPQSYGPLNFGEKTDAVCKEIKEVFSKVDLLFAREAEGVEVLKNECGVCSAVLSPDIVLQAHEIKWENVFTAKPEVRVPLLETENNVGIVPNGETVRNGDKTFVLDCYKRMIGMLRSKGKEIYIFRHSDDLQLCRAIYEEVKSDNHCHLIEDELDCLAYSEFVKQFEFVIASRFHSVVHAYREGIPALVLGWAIKYQELTKLFGQEKYAFDITKSDSCDVNEMMKQLDLLSENYEDEAKLIGKKLAEIRQKSCFDLCWEITDKL